MDHLPDGLRGGVKYNCTLWVEHSPLHRVITGSTQVDEVREPVDLRHLEDWEGRFPNAKDICSIFVLSPEFIQQMNVECTFGWGIF